MKINKIFVLCSVFAVMLVISCKPFTGSGYNGSDPVTYEHELPEDIKTFNEEKNCITKSNITISAEISQASKTSLVTVTVLGKTTADTSTFEEAFKFYSLSDNTNDASLYPKRADTALTAKLQSSKTDNVLVTGDFIVDTHEITNQYIAVVVNAAALKDKSGAVMINNDGNTKAGETTDNLVYYINVVADADGDPTSGLTWNPVTPNKKENFCPNLTDNLEKLFDLADWFTDGSVSIAEGKIVAVSPVVSYAAVGSTVEAGYYSNYTDTLKAIFEIELIAPGEATWKKDSAATVVYSDTTHQYTVTSSTFAAGTKWRFKFNPVVITENTVATATYGHPISRQLCTKSWVGTENNNAAGTMTYYAASPSNIVNNRTTAFSVGDISRDEIQTAQKDFLSVASKGNGKFEVTLNSSYEFDSWSDFIATDYSSTTKYGTKLPATVTQKEDDKNKIVIQLDNKWYTSSVLIWAGEGVSIKENSTNSDQKKFGSYKWASDKDASGYVCIGGSTTFTMN